jgi:hypothetical protein
METFTLLFWIASTVFLIASVLIVVQRKGDLSPLALAQLLGGVGIFVGSKLGREFLGLA